MGNQNAEPYGPAPYKALEKLVDQVQRAIGEDWTNNVDQHAPESDIDAVDAWDGAAVLVSQLEEAVEALSKAVTEGLRAAEERAEG